MRRKIAYKNVIMTLLFQVMYLGVSFACRTVFTHVLGAEYLGLNGLFTNVLTILSFVELGIGNAIVYKLYKPLSENDNDTVRMYLCYFKRVYSLIMLIVCIIGIMMLPFLKFIVSTHSITADIRMFYLFFLADSVLSYVYVYKKSILIADQKNYIVEAYGLIFNVIINIAQIVVVVITRNYVMYLIIKIVFDVLCNVATGRRAEKLYPYIKGIESSNSLPDGDIKEFKQNLKGLFMEKLASVSFDGTDNVFISVFCDITIVGVFSQYTMILTACNGVLNKAFGAITSSIGKLGVESEGQHVERVFRRLWFANGALYGLLFVELSSLLQLFVTDLWLNPDYMLTATPIFLMVAETSARGMHYPVYMVRSAYGFFSQLREVAVIGAVVNIVLDVILGEMWGLVGILVATIVARVIVYISDIYVIYYMGFKVGVYEFLELAAKIICYTGVVFALSQYLVRFTLFDNSWLDFFVDAILIAVIYILGFVVTFRNNSDFLYYQEIVKCRIKPVK